MRRFAAPAPRAARSPGTLLRGACVSCIKISSTTRSCIPGPGAPGGSEELKQGEWRSLGCCAPGFFSGIRRGPIVSILTCPPNLISQMAVNNYFVERRNQFHKSTHQKLFRSNPFRSLVPVSAFDLSEGRTPTVRTLTHELPSAYPTALVATAEGGSGATVGVSDGSSSPCDQAATTIKRGEVTRTFELFGTAFKTDVLCLSDLKRAQDAAAAVAGFEKALNEYVTVFWSDWYRLMNIKMIDTKVSTKADDVVDSAISTKANHTDVPSLPNADLNWNHLKQLYWELCRNGLADELAVGRDSKGRPILPLYAGVGIINALWTDNNLVRESVKYFDAAKNLQHLGYDGAVNGFLPLVDLFPIRYGDSDGISATSELAASRMIYPTINANATSGRKYQANPHYRLQAKGGHGQFEVATILGRDCYEAKFEAVDPANFAGAEFTPTNYTGEFSWINNRTFEGDNDLGNKGYYRADIRIAAKPIFPEFGVSILTKARDV